MDEPVLAGVRWVASLDEVDAPGLRVVASAQTKPELLTAIYRAVDAPAYAATNYDALADILGDLGWLPGEPVRLGWAPSAALETDVRAQVLHIIVSAASASAGTARPLAVYLVV